MDPERPGLDRGSTHREDFGLAHGAAALPAWASLPDQSRWAGLLGDPIGDAVLCWQSRTAEFVRFAPADEASQGLLVRRQLGLSTDDLQRLYLTQRTVESALRQTQERVRVPTPRAVDAVGGVILSDHIEGEDGEDRLRRAVAAGAWADARSVTRAAARALAAFHAIPTDLDAQSHSGSVVSDDVRTAKQERRRDRRRPSDVGLAWRYGDFAPYNLIFAEDITYLIDLPVRLLIAPRSRDLASLVFHCRRIMATATEIRGHSKAAEDVVDETLAAYADVAAVPLAGLRRRVFREESRRALNMARKRLRQRRFRSTLGYISWTHRCSRSLHPQVDASRLF